MSTTIYGLMDPRTQEMRYVGKTIKRLAVRLSEHVRPGALRPKTRKNGWLKGLRAAGHKPDGVVLDVVDDARGSEAEIDAIAYYRAIGCSLTNGTDGGEGGATRVGWTMPTETRAKISAAHRGRKHSPESRARMSAAQMGKHREPKTPATKEKIAASLRGRPGTRRGMRCSVEMRAKISATLSGRPQPWNRGRAHTEESKEKIAAAKRGKPNLHWKPMPQAIRDRFSREFTGKHTGAENPFFGRKHDDATRAIIKAKRAEQRVTWCKAVLRSDGRRYVSASEAARDIGATVSDVAMVARGRRKRTRGFGFSYLEAP